jgi:hypothetical protein
LVVEADALGVNLAPATLPLETARDFQRARMVGQSYSERWYRNVVNATPAEAKAATQGSLDRIVATETSESFNTGRAKYLDTRPALGLLRVWDATLDKRGCPICAGADGTIVGANEPFPWGEPGAVHVNCRCVWTLLRSTETGDGTLIEPRQPTLVQVPGAASPFAPKGIVPSGGKLAVSTETKALAKRLDDALGNVAKDGGASARAELRALLGQHGIKARSLGAGANAIKVTDPSDMGGMAGFHEWDGTLRLAPKTLRDSRAALRKLQLGVDPGDDHANALNVLLHEEIHGASALTKQAFQGAGAAIEEVATELAARRITSQLMGREIGAVYADEIAGLTKALGKVSKAKPEALAKRIDAAVSMLKSSAPLANTPAQHVSNFVDALKLTPKQRASLSKEINETEWWKPGQAPAKVARPKATPKPKAAAAKPAKPRAPPKIKDPQVQELLDAGFHGIDTRLPLRPESLAHLRAGGPIYGGNPILKIRADGVVDIVDGRHRLAIARERGETSIVVRIMTEGPRGGTKDYGERLLTLRQAAGGKQMVSPRTKPKRKR